MRTFHIGGIAQGGSQSFVEAGSDGKIVFRNKSVIENSFSETIVMSRNMEVSIVDPSGLERCLVTKVSFWFKAFGIRKTLVERDKNCLNGIHIHCR